VHLRATHLERALEITLLRVQSTEVNGGIRMQSACLRRGGNFVSSRFEHREIARRCVVRSPLSLSVQRLLEHFQRIRQHPADEPCGSPFMPVTEKRQGRRASER
jgi:hypothetical protein